MINDHINYNVFFTMALRFGEPILLAPEISDGTSPTKLI